MFGEYHYRVDKGRVFIPPKYRHHFKSGLQLTLLDEEKRYIVAYPCEKPELKLDARGRITIPKALQSEVNITDMAIIVGSDRYLEIWNPLKWQEEVAKAQKEAEALVRNEYYTENKPSREVV